MFSLRYFFFYLLLICFSVSNTNAAYPYFSRLLLGNTKKAECTKAGIECPQAHICKRSKRKGLKCVVNRKKLFICGGKDNIKCQKGYICQDIVNDKCNLKCGDKNCQGYCVKSIGGQNLCDGLNELAICSYDGNGLFGYCFNQNNCNEKCSDTPCKRYCAHFQIKDRKGNGKNRQNKNDGPPAGLFNDEIDTEEYSDSVSNDDGNDSLPAIGEINTNGDSSNYSNQTRSQSSSAGNINGEQSSDSTY